MATALETASLVMVPSGYEDGTLGSLQPLDGTGDFTFTRGSNISATRVNEDGYIEKGYENLLLQSNSFDTTWIRTNSIVTGGQEGYDGTNDAWLLTGLVGSHALTQNISNSGVATYSLYAKAGTGSGIRIRAIGSTNYTMNVTLTDGTIFSNAGIDGKVINAGNGWYRYEFTFNTSITSIQMRITNGATGDFAGTIYIQDAMLNQGLAAYPYLGTTTTTAKGGISEDMPRLDYSSGRCSLLLEPARTNLITNSEYIVTSTFPFTEGLTINNNYELSPEGIINAAKIIPTAVNSRHNLRTHIATPNNFDIISCFVKANGYDYVQLASWATGANYINFDLTNGTIGSIGSAGPSIYGIKDYGNGWYRIHANVQASGSGLIGIGIVTSASAAWAEPFTGNGTDGILIYGVQLEQDAPYPTSYIPTYGVSQTRLGDVCIKTGISSLIGQTEGTLFIEWEQQLTEDVYAMFGLNDGLNNNRVNLALNQFGNSKLGLVYRINGTLHYSNVNIQNLNVDTTYKAAVAYTQTTLKMYLNSSLVVNETGFSASGGTFNELNFKLQSSGSSFPFAMPTKQVLVFPTALSDEACIELTTI